MKKRNSVSRYAKSSPSVAGVDLDEKDILLLRELAKDSRKSQRALSRLVGISPPAVAERLARFERLGVIRHYSISIDWDRLGLGIVVLVNVILETGCDYDTVIRHFKEIPELEELTVLTGRFDFLARFRVGDQGHLKEIVLDRLPVIPGVLRAETMLGLREIETQDFVSRIFDSFSPVAVGNENEYGHSDNPIME